jgi:hypothetical protein
VLLAGGLTVHRPLPGDYGAVPNFALSVVVMLPHHPLRRDVMPTTAGVKNQLVLLVPHAKLTSLSGGQSVEGLAPGWKGDRPAPRGPSSQ